MSTLKPKIEIVTEEKDTVLRVHNCRTMYAHVSAPREDEHGQPFEYSCDLLVPKDAEGIEQVKVEIRNMGSKKFGTGWKCPVLKDGDRAYADFVDQGGDKDDKMKCLLRGHYIISANTKMKDRNTGRLIPPVTKGSPIYSGCYASAKIKVSPYDFSEQNTGNRVFGIKGYLNGMVFKADGEPLGRPPVSLDDLGDAGTSSMAAPPMEGYEEPPPQDAGSEPDPW